MTYEISSVWTKIHSKEIEELNRIVSEKYYVEQEIARKLHIIKVAKEVLEEEIKRFNFDVVIRFMKQVGWTWAYSIAGENTVPTKEDFIKQFYGPDFLEHALYDMIELNKSYFSASTGGIIFQMGCDDLKNISKYNTWCSIGFDISNWHDEFSKF